MNNLLLVAPSILLMSSANVLLKARIDILDKDAPSNLFGRVIGYFSDPSILAAIALVALSVGWWLSVCSRVQISTVYPVLQAGVIVCTAVFAVAFLGEAMNFKSLLSIALIVVGVILLQ